MKEVLYFTFTVLFLLALSTQAVAQDHRIFAKGEIAPNVHHTGTVWLNHLSEADSIFNYNVTLATFEPGAKLDWHIHPGGQQLLITHGTGYYQE
jgi:quercetin dioxygenase-like cupin family protein